MWPDNPPLLLAVHAASRVADAVTAVQEKLQEAGDVAGRDALLRVSEHWLRWIRLPWQPEFADHDRLLATARRALAEAWQIDDADLLLLIAVDDAPWGADRAVVAIERELLDALTASLQAAGIRRVAVEPLTSALSAQQGDAADAVFYVVDAATVAVVVQRAGRLAAVFSQPVTDDADLQKTALVAAGSAARTGGGGFAGPTRVYGFADLLQPDQHGPHEVRAAGRRAPVFVALPPPLTRRSLLAVAACALVLAGAALLAWHTGSSRAAQENELAIRTAPLPQAAPLRADQQAQVRAVNRAIRQLNVPVTALLRAVPPRDGLGVALLGIDIAGSYGSGGGAVSQIEAQARTPADMTTYVAELNTHPVLASALLSHHELDRDVPGQPYRFTVETRWKETSAPVATP